MRILAFLRKARKGAAFVEYVSLIGLIGVVVIFAIVQFSGTLEDTFGRSTTTIAEQVDVGNPGGPDGGGPTPGGPDGGPDIPVFPPPSVPDSGLEHAFTYDVYMSYWDPTSITFDQIAAAIEAEAVDARANGNNPTWYYSGNPPANWQSDVTWTGLERSEPYPDPNQAFPYNEFAFTTSGFSHNVGPLPGWGDQPEDLTNCLDDFPQSEQYQVRGNLSNGDQILIYLNLPPEECILNYDVYRDIIVTHNGAGAGSYGAISNTELAGISNLDWTQATWTLVPDSFQYYTPSDQILSGLSLSGNGYVYNPVPGPAWQNPDTGTSSCYEDGANASATIRGIHPDGEMVSFYITFTSQIGDTGIPGGDPTCAPGYR